MKTSKGKSAWIIEWSPHRDDIGMSDIAPIILPHRWSKNKVIDFLRVLYWNSPLHCLFETSKEVQYSKSPRIHISDSGARIDYSEFGGTVLIATHVQDLKISFLPTGEELMEWTLSPHLSRDKITGDTIETSKRVKRSFTRINTKKTA